MHGSFKFIVRKKDEKKMKTSRKVGLVGKDCAISCSHNSFNQGFRNDFGLVRTTMHCMSERDPTATYSSEEDVLTVICEYLFTPA